MQREQDRATSAHFVTITYNTFSVPITPNGFMTLRKKDMQDFFKRLRKLTDNKIKYYLAGEYGTKTNRPHYHAIIFNVPDDTYYIKAWTVDNVPRGTIHVGHVTGNSIAYTMKYIDKSNFTRRHERDDREKEFSLMSKKLGENFLTQEMITYYKNDISRICITKEDGHKIAMPKYYRDKIFTDDEKRAQLPIIQNAVSSNMDDLYFEYINLYGKDNIQYTFDEWLESHKLGRYYRFYRNQKQRNL